MCLSSLQGVVLGTEGWSLDTQTPQGQQAVLRTHSPAFLVGDSRKPQNEKLGSFRWSGQAPEDVTQGLPGFQEDHGDKRKVL